MSQENTILTKITAPSMEIPPLTHSWRWQQPVHSFDSQPKNKIISGLRALFKTNP